MTRFEYLHFVTNFLQRKSDSNVLTNRFPVSMLSNNTSYMIVTSFHSFPCLFINSQNPRTRIRTSFLQNCRIPHFPRIHLREAWIPELCIVRVRYVFKIQASHDYSATMLSSSLFFRPSWWLLSPSLLRSLLRSFS